MSDDETLTTIPQDDLEKLVDETRNLRAALEMAIDFETLSIGEIDAKYGKDRANRGWLDVAKAALPEAHPDLEPPVQIGDRRGRGTTRYLQQVEDERTR